MRRPWNRPTAEAGISTVSIADIAFLLIVFFMVTTVFAATKGLDFELAPEDQRPQSVEPVPAVWLVVSSDGALSIDGHPAAVEDLLPYLAPKLARWPDKPIVLCTSPEAPYGAMVRVYDELMLAEEPPGEGGLGLASPPNISVPTHREIREYEELFGPGSVPCH